MFHPSVLRQGDNWPRSSERRSIFRESLWALYPKTRTVLIVILVALLSLILWLFLFPVFSKTTVAQ